MIENVLVLIKPDAMTKALAGTILSRFAETKLRLIAVQLVVVSEDLARKHYQALSKEPFFERLVAFMTGQYTSDNKVMALVYRGENAVMVCRALAGATNPEEADPTSIRGALGRVTTKGHYENAVHVSASRAEAENEIKLWFRPEQIAETIYPTKTVLVEQGRKTVWI